MGRTRGSLKAEEFSVPSLVFWGLLCCCGRGARTWPPPTPRCAVRAANAEGGKEHGFLAAQLSSSPEHYDDDVVDGNNSNSNSTR